MATAETVEMGPGHPPKYSNRPHDEDLILIMGREESFKAFQEIEADLKKMLQQRRHATDSKLRPFIVI
jgi:hypothetical protein